MRIEMRGARFGLLTVLEEAGRADRKITWLCHCECGARKVVGGPQLRKGDTVSCGCKRSAPKFVESDFMAYVTVQSSGCWEWNGTRDKASYGLYQKSRGARNTSRRQSAHRWAYETFNGPIPAGFHVCHHCDNPPCCNPSHLFAGTAGDNMRDMYAKGRGRGGRKHDAARAESAK